jgi:hypothetical protein
MMAVKIKVSLALIFAVVLLAAYGFLFPTIQYLECDQGELGRTKIIEEGIVRNDSYGYAMHEFIKVKKYMYGAQYTLNDYDISDCHFATEDWLLCGLDDDLISLNLATGEVDLQMVISQAPKKIEEKNMWECKQVERVVQ